MSNLQEALAAFSEGSLSQAQNICLDILSEKPDCSPAWHLIGVIAQNQAQYARSTRYLEKALFYDKEDACIYYNLASSYISFNKIEEAIQLYQKAIELRPSFAEAHYNLGNIYAQSQQLSKAECCYRQAAQYQQEHAQTFTNLGFSLLYQGKIGHALESFRKALKINPADEAAQDNLLLATHYAIFLSPLERFLEHQNWGRTLSQAIMPLQPLTVLPKQRLRIGYLSPDFCEHSVSYFFESLLANHSIQAYEIFCYSSLNQEDDVTSRLRSYPSHWRESSHLSDLQLAEQIRTDQIDILVELAGHTTNNRLRVLAYKPAPIQITYLGYPGTTGLPGVDYRITDFWADPLLNDAYHTEKLLRLKSGFLCYLPPTTAPSVSMLPAQRNGYITFGSFNNLPKINPSVVELWAGILKDAPDSRLLLKSAPLGDKQTQVDYENQFAAFGIPSDRLIFLGRLPTQADHLASYAQIDIGLDPFPYNGTTTTCESLWMGVPVITLAGTAQASRVGVSILSCIGLDECIADTPEQYLQIAIELANNKQKLEDFRTSIRFWMAASPLCDGEAFTRRLENTYRQIWQEKCELTKSSL
jgi:protein O-GlcNAc transferase